MYMIYINIYICICVYDMVYVYDMVRVYTHTTPRGPQAKLAVVIKQIVATYVLLTRC
jgi:hypothetical protein